MWIGIRVSAVESSESARNASTLFCLAFPKGLSDARMNDKLFPKIFQNHGLPAFAQGYGGQARLKRIADCAERQRGKRRGESGRHVQRQWREFLQKAAKKTKIAIGFQNPSFSLFPSVNLLLSANGFEPAVFRWPLSH